MKRHANNTINFPLSFIPTSFPSENSTDLDFFPLILPQQHLIIQNENKVTLPSLKACVHAAYNYGFKLYMYTCLSQQPADKCQTKGKKQTTSYYLPSNHHINSHDYVPKAWVWNGVLQALWRGTPGLYCSLSLMSCASCSEPVFLCMHKLTLSSKTRLNDCLALHFWTYWSLL